MVLHTLRIALPAFWAGLVGALGFIETPLKFLAPGVTLEIGLGIGRLVLTAADIAGVALLIAITVVSLVRPRVGRKALWTLGALWVVLLVQVAVIRPLLNARTDAVLAGTAGAGESPLHIFYIVADLMLLIGMVVYIVFVARSARLVAAAGDSAPPARA